MTTSNPLWLLSAILCWATALHSAGMEDLKPVTNPEKIAPGIWRITLGDMSEEPRYTDLAATPPRQKELDQKTELPFPFTDEALAYQITHDGQISVRIPSPGTPESSGVQPFSPFNP